MKSTKMKQPTLNTTVRRTGTLIVFLMLTFQFGIGQQVIYVNKDVAIPGNGSSWSSAYADLQLALTAAISLSGVKEIWVSQGEYKPTSTLDRTISFSIPPQTTIVGGFVGNETSKVGRDWRNRRTVLSGDIGVQFDASDNSYHVITATNLNADSGLDGVIVKYGNANGATGSSNYDRGGGMLVVNTATAAGPTINQCEFYENSAVSSGGGLATISNGAAIGVKVSNSYFKSNSAGVGAGVVNIKTTGNNTSQFINCIFEVNHATQFGGAIASIGADAVVVNCTIVKNNSLSNGSAIYTSNAAGSVSNSIIWKNFVGTNEPGLVTGQINSVSSTTTITYNLVEGGYGVPADNNFDANPAFVTDPKASGVNPRTSIIPIENTSRKYENALEMNGVKPPAFWTYYTYRDVAYDKLYMVGQTLSVLDFKTTVNGHPTVTNYNNYIYFGMTQRLDKSIHSESNRLFIASYYGSGIYSIDRGTGVVTPLNLIDGFVPTPDGARVYDLVVDDINDLLYASVFYYTSSTEVFRGLLELNLKTNSKRWITTTSTPVAVTSVPLLNVDNYWGIRRLHLDDVNSILYFSTGNGLWWWDRTTNATGLINTSGGISLAPGNPNLPSNTTTGILFDNLEQKLYVGTHAGLFVWNKADNTSKVYNTSNSAIGHNLVNLIAKNDASNLIYVACELGGLFTINTVTGQERHYSPTEPGPVNPQIPNTNVGSVYYDSNDQKLYVNCDYPTGAAWIWDYKNMIPEFGDLRLASGSPAIDKANANLLPVGTSVDAAGQPRTVDYAWIQASNGLDVGAFERPYECPTLTSDFTFTRTANTVTFTPVVGGDNGCTLSYLWTFGDGQSSTSTSPSHTYFSVGLYDVQLQITGSCGTCPTPNGTKNRPVAVTNDLAGAIFCAADARVAFGSDGFANGHRLSVKGKIIAEGVQLLQVAQWPDYVFAPGYQLKPLSELKAYVRLNKHLPSMSSAAVIQSNGIDLAEMSKSLVKTTEELTLYLINLDSRLTKLEARRRK